MGIFYQEINANSNFWHGYDAENGTLCPPTKTRMTTGYANVPGMIRSGWRSPGWKVAVRNHIDATTNYTYEKYSPGLMAVSLDVRYKQPKTCPATAPAIGTVKSSSYYSAAGLLNTVDFSGAERDGALAQKMSLSRLNSNVAGRLSPVQGGVILGELNETLRMLRSPLGSLRRYADDYLYGLDKYQPRKRRRATSKERARDLAKMISDSYLEFVYGALPLGRDIADIITEIPAKCYQYDNASAFASDSANQMSYSYGVNTTLFGHAAIMDRTISRTQTVSSSRKVGIVTGVALNNLYQGIQTKSDRFGMTVRSFVPTAYNLLPWSFLLDYFTNMGSIADAFSIPSKSIYYHSHTMTWKQSSSYYQSYRSTLPAGHSLSASGSATSSKFRLSRTAEKGLGIPDLIWEPPSLKAVTNMAALATHYASTSRRVRDLL